MKKYIFAIIVLIFAVSCENELPFNIDENPPKLVINALFDTGQEQNFISLALTGRQKATYIDEASVGVYVNGELKEYIPAPNPDPDSPDFNYPIYYRSRIRFKPNDIVKIEAKTNDGKYYAWSEVTVPHPITIENMDTTIVVKNGACTRTEKYLRTRTTFTDNGYNTNYYRIAMVLDMEAETKSNTTSRDTIIHKTVNESLIVNEDVVLTDGQPYANDDDETFTTIRNIYGVFDNSRINGTYTMTTSLRIPYSHMQYYFYDYTTGDGSYYGQYTDFKRIGIKVRLRLMSISKAQYFYLKELNIYDSVDYDDYFNLPVKFPANVEGGTGIFGISSGDEITIHLEDYIPSNYN